MRFSQTKLKLLVVGLAGIQTRISLMISLLNCNAPSGGRTRKTDTSRRILSPVRLPISPPAHIKFNCLSGTRTHDILINSQTL